MARLFAALRCVLLVGATASAGCGATDAGRAREETGSLIVGRTAELGGARYELEAAFEGNGPEYFTLNLAYATDPFEPKLVPGAYELTIQPDFRVLKDIAIAEVPVASELVSEPTQPFLIRTGEATRLAYRFAVDGGTLSFDGE